MDSPIVYIEKEPFLTMIFASVETFKRECLGYIFGYKPTQDRNSFVITNAIPIQLAKKRKNSEVEQSKLSMNNISNCFDGYPSLFRKIGDFHSHPEWGRHKVQAIPSKQDIKDMIEEEIPIGIIIAISLLNKERILWQNTSGGGVKGSLGKYKFHLNVFRVVKDEDNNRTEESLTVYAPAATRSLNRALGYK